MPKNKPNKGLLKRIRLTKSGKVKFTRAFGRHKRSHKSGNLLRSYHRPAFAHAADRRPCIGHAAHENHKPRHVRQAGWRVRVKGLIARSFEEIHSSGVKVFECSNLRVGITGATSCHAYVRVPPRTGNERDYSGPLADTGEQRNRHKQQAKVALVRAGQFAYRDRRNRRREFRRLWITRISAACRMRGTRYSVLINGLSHAGIKLNRKMLSQIAIEDPATFDTLVEQAKGAATAHQVG